MKFRTSAPIVMISMVIAAIATLSFVSYLISHRMVGAFEEEQFSLMGKITQSKLTGAEGKAISAAETIASMPAVRKAFAERNRDELLAVTHDAYQVLTEKYGISQAQFHLPPATSFARLHNPKKFGDDLSYRNIVVEVNRTNAIRKGIEITTSGVGIFGTRPMADEAGKAVGSFEVGLEFESLLDELKKTYGFELGVFINEKILHDTATALKGDVFNAQNRVGSFVKFRSTHPELIQALVTDGDINITEESHYLREANGIPYGVVLQPVYDYAKKQIGVVATVRNFSETRSADSQAVVWQGLLGLVCSVLLIGVILVVVRGLVLRPMAALDERIKALAEGAPGNEAPDTGAWCDEMRGLAENCERLAGKSADRPGQGDAL